MLLLFFFGVRAVYGLFVAQSTGDTAVPSDFYSKKKGAVRLLSELNSCSAKSPKAVFVIEDFNFKRRPS